ncbi:helix-turn-helix domain-containing protein [Pseudochrobactrum sp. MP213Fo]|uniref:helix-turn-helix domain-containing protein n=1 Tax=Pseudochrobactrum sp. MP213Fo TaxID=3022250 RepID=UPI003B9EFD14
MDSLFAKTELEQQSKLPAYLFRQSDISVNNKFSDNFKTLIHHNNQLAYIISQSGEFSYEHDHHVVFITLAPIKDLYWSLQSKFSEKFDAPAGSVLIIPKNTEYKLSLPIEADFIQLALDEDLLDNLQDITGSLQIEELFPHPSRLPNPKALLVANLIRSELLKNAPVSGGYVHALLSVLMVQLVQNHSFLRAGNARQENGGLSYQASRRIEAYLRENFMRKLSIEKMAHVLGVSGGHFLTSFRESFGQTPHQFLLMLRLNSAEEMLLETDISLAEIADRAGFSSQSHMTTALKKCRLTTPGELRRKRVTAGKK